MLKNLNHNLIRNESRGTGTVINKLSPMASVGIPNKKQNNMELIVQKTNKKIHLFKIKYKTIIFESRSKGNFTQIQLIM